MNDQEKEELKEEVLKELQHILHSETGGNFEYFVEDNIVTAKEYNPKWDGDNDQYGVSIHSGREVKLIMLGLDD